MSITHPSFTLGWGRWYENKSFDCETCCCGELECYTGPCVCFSQGSGFLTCLLSALLFLPNCVIGTIMGLYNWIMCDSCLSDNMEDIEYQKKILESGLYLVVDDVLKMVKLMY